MAQGNSETNGMRRGNAGSNNFDSVAAMGERAYEKGKEMADQASEKIQNAGNTVSERTDKAISSVGEKVTGFADTIRGNIDTQAGGKLNRAAKSVADKLESGGQYLSENGLNEISRDLTAVIKSNPIGSLCVGLGLGFLVGRSMSKR